MDIELYFLVLLFIFRKSSIFPAVKKEKKENIELPQKNSRTKKYN